MLQEIHMALWESLARFDGRSALGTWVYRVAHNTATSICVRRKSARVQLVSLEDIELPSASFDRERDLDERQGMERLLELSRATTASDRRGRSNQSLDVDLENAEANVRRRQAQLGVEGRLGRLRFLERSGGVLVRPRARRTGQRLTRRIRLGRRRCATAREEKDEHR